MLPAALWRPLQDMELLQSQQDNLSLWLSADSAHILNECGDILSVNEHKKITEQPEEEQMSLLLEMIISKGPNTCEAFMDILRRNQGRHHELQQFFRSSSDDSAGTSIFADESSVVTSSTLRNINTKSLTYNVETVSSPRGNSSGNSASGAQYTATGGSVIVADRIDGAKAENINFSVNIKPSQVPSAPAGTADYLRQHPAGKTIREKKEKLMSEHHYVVQHVDQKSIVSHREHQNLKCSSGPQEAITGLLDRTLGAGSRGGGSSQTLRAGTTGGGSSQTLGTGSRGGGSRQTLRAGTTGGGSSQTLGAGSRGRGSRQTLGAGSRGSGSRQTLRAGSRGRGSRQTLGAGSRGSGPGRVLRIGSGKGGPRRRPGRAPPRRR